MKQRFVLGLVLVTALVIAGCTASSPPDASDASTKCSQASDASCTSVCAPDLRKSGHYCAGGNQWCCVDGGRQSGFE